MQQKQAELNPFHYSLTSNKHLYPSSSSLLKWTTNQSRWLYSIIDWLSAHISVTRRHKWSNATRISQDHSVPAFSHTQQTRLPQLVLVDRMEEEQVTVTLFHYSLTFSAHVGVSSPRIIECNTNEPSWLRSIIHSLPTNTSAPARPRWSSERGTSHGDCVRLFTHFQRTRRSHLFIATLECNRNKSTWLCSIIHSLQSDMFAATFSLMFEGYQRKPQSSCVIIHASLVHIWTAALNRCSGVIRMVLLDGIQLFTHSERHSHLEARVGDRVLLEQIQVILFKYSLTSERHVHHSSSLMLEWYTNKS